MPAVRVLRCPTRFLLAHPVCQGRRKTDENTTMKACGYDGITSLSILMSAGPQLNNLDVCNHARLLGPNCASAWALGPALRRAPKTPATTACWTLPALLLLLNIINFTLSLKELLHQWLTFLKMSSPFSAFLCPARMSDTSLLARYARYRSRCSSVNPQNKTWAI